MIITRLYNCTAEFKNILKVGLRYLTTYMQLIPKYSSVKIDNGSSEGLTPIKVWMLQSFLHFHETKTDITIFHKGNL